MGSLIKLDVFAILTVIAMYIIVCLHKIDGSKQWKEKPPFHLEISN